MRKLWWLAPAIMAVVVGGCAANPATGGNNFSLLSAAQEREIGTNTANEALKQFGLYEPNGRTTQYVMDLCRRTWAVTEMASEPVQCLFLDSEQFNAWATPGYINVYRGLLPFVQSEAQLVSVIGHESGHVTARHVGQQQTGRIIGGLLATAVGVYVGSQTDNQSQADLAYGLAGLGVGAGLASYSRTHEYQADELGQRYMERLGYDKRESVAMVGSLLAVENYSDALSAAFNDGQPGGANTLLSGLFASHPANPQRQAEAAKLAGGWPDGGVRLPAGITPATPADDPQGRARYHAMIDGLAYGPKRAYGVAARERFYLPAQGFAWQLPDGFVFEFAGHDKDKDLTLWQGVHVASGVKADVISAPYKQGMDVDYTLNEVLGFKNKLQLLALNAANKPAEAAAYTGTKGGSKPYRLVAVTLPDADRIAILVFRFKDEAQQTREEGALISSVQHSRFYDAAARSRLQPLKLSSFRATANDSVAKRAAAMPQGALREEWFRALNGLGKEGVLQPGVWYKTVVDVNG